jgi:GR25 family glycosyltransferase involved in LPS biosynthesis
MINISSNKSNIDYYVIHCEKHTDRLDHIENHLKKNIPELRVWKGTFIENFEENTEDQIKKYCSNIHYDTSIYKFKSPGELGCYLSHHLLIKHIMENDNQNGFTVILEDDVQLCNGFKEKIEDILNNVEIDFDIIFTSLIRVRRFKNSIRKNKINEFNNIIKRSDARGEGTFGMVYSNKNLKKIYQVLTCPTDAIDGHYIKQIRKNNLNAYVCTPYLCVHPGNYSTSIQDKNEVINQKLFIEDRSLFS